MSVWGYGSATHGIGTAAADEAGTLAVANVNRKYLRLQNDSDTTVYLSLGGSADVNTGIRLNMAGSPDSVYEMTRGQSNIYTGQVTGKHGGSGAKLILVTEGQ